MLKKRSNIESTLFRKRQIDKKYFSKRRITPAALKDLDWEKLTGHFDIDNIKSIVRFWSDPVERNLVIDSIEAQVKVCESNDPDNLPF